MHYYAAISTAEWNTELLLLYRVLADSAVAPEVVQNVTLQWLCRQKIKFYDSDVYLNA